MQTIPEMWNNVIEFFKTYWLALLLLMATLAVGSYCFPLNEKLNTAAAPNRIVSLEVAWGHDRAVQVVSSWKNSDAIKAINTDYYFIIAYTLFLCIASWKKGSQEIIQGVATARRRAIFCIMGAVAGVSDVIENIFMTVFINDPAHSLNAGLFSFPATLKFVLVVIVILYLIDWILKPVSNFLGDFFTVVWNNRIIVITLLVLFGMMSMDQGQDLLLNLNAFGGGVVVFYLLITVLAMLNWFLPKYYEIQTPMWRGFTKFLDIQLPVVQNLSLYIPRLLGAITFLLPAACILNAMIVFKLQVPVAISHPYLLFMAVTALYIFILHHQLIEQVWRILSARTVRRVVIITGVVVFALISWFGVDSEGDPHNLIYLSVGLFLLSVFFLLVTTARTLTINGTPVFTKLAAIHFSYFVIIPGMLAFVFFFVINVFPLTLSKFDLGFLTFPFALSALVTYVLFFSAVMMIGRLAKVQAVTLLIVLMVVMAIYVPNNFHDVPLTSQNVEPKIKLEAAIEQWISSRKPILEKLDKSQTYPIVIVNTYGGGIRAAAWTGLVVSYLDSITRLSPHGKFQDHVIAYSGASGGTIGASVLCALEKQKLNYTTSDMMRFYRNDFLSPVMAGLLGRDGFFSTIGIGSSNDRSVLQESTWDYQLGEIGTNFYDRDFESVWVNDTHAFSTDVPMLFSNTTYIEDGVKGIVAPVALSGNDFPNAILLRDSLRVNLKMSTAAFMSARFPFISPAGNISAPQKRFHFMDGGLKENSGAETAVQLKHVIARVLARMQKDSAYAKVKVVLVSLKNTGQREPDPPSKKNIFQLTAPVTALATNWEGNTAVAQKAAQKEFLEWVEFSPKADSIFAVGKKFVPVLPLGWQISPAALRRLKEGIPLNKNEIKKIEGWVTE